MSGLSQSGLAESPRSLGRQGTRSLCYDTFPERSLEAPHFVHKVGPREGDALPVRIGLATVDPRVDNRHEHRGTFPLEQKGRIALIAGLDEGRAKEQGRPPTRSRGRPANCAVGRVA